jgi:hypothetical protein
MISLIRVNWNKGMVGRSETSHRISIGHLNQHLSVDLAIHQTTNQLKNIKIQTFILYAMNKTYFSKDILTFHHKLYHLMVVAAILSVGYFDNEINPSFLDYMSENQSFYRLIRQ